jgi:hypothetical protein
MSSGRTMLCALRAGFGLLIAGGLVLVAAVGAEPADPLGAVGRYHLPIPTPSTDTSPQTFVMNGQTYVIPRNYIEGLSKDNDGDPNDISIRAVLPDFIGLTDETIRCGVGYQDPCSARVVVIDLSRGIFPTSGSQQLSNSKKISHPDEIKGPCGLRYYESLGSTERGGVVFQFFFIQLPNIADISFLRCAKPGSAFAQRCNSRENIGDGNSFYYNFDRSKLCEWGVVRSKSLDLIRSFKLEGARSSLAANDRADV